MKKNVKAFTLIELLAVIVILAVIAAIATPIILGVINDSKYKAFKESLNNTFHAYELYAASHNVEPGTIVDIKDLPLDSKGLTGKVFENEEGNIELKQVTDGTYSAEGTKDDLNFFEGPVDELVKNKLDVKISLNAKEKSILVTVDVIEGVPTSYSYQIIEPEKYKKEINNIKENTYTFDELEEGTEYKIKVIVKNKIGLTKEIIKTIKLEEKKEIKLELTPTGKYIKEGTVTITYPKLDNVTYKYKWDEEDFTVVSERTTTIKAQNGTLTAIVESGEETILSNQITITNIDNIDPVLTLSTVQKTTNSITIPYSIVEEHIKEVTCKYSNTDGSYSIDAQATNSACSLTNLDNTKTYYYQVCVTDEADNKVCKTGDTKPEVVVNPNITITHSPSNAGASTTNGYSKEEVASVTFSDENVTKPSYYIKSTLKGTTNVNVLASCTEENSKPKTCTNESTNVIEANTWYKVGGYIDVTYNTGTTSNQTIYAITYDGTNYSGAATGTILKIDKTNPTISFVTNGNNTAAKLQSSVVNITEGQSGINVLKYKWSTSNTGSASDGTTFATGDTVTTPANLSGTYYLCVYVTDKVGNSNNLCSGAFKLDNAIPTITKIDVSGTSISNISATVTANDANSGLHATAYSCDGVWQTSNICKFTTVGNHTIKVRDKLGFESAVKNVTYVENAPSDTAGLKKVVYFNPVTGNYCNKTDAVSTTGTKTGCMKWYAYVEDSTSYTALLDHNTTAKVAFNSTGAMTPKEIQTELNNLTSVSKWKNTPKIISGQDVADICGLMLWSSNAEGAQSYKLNNSYYWMYENTSNCSQKGCKVEDSTITGYLTSTAALTIYSNAGVWAVKGDKEENFLIDMLNTAKYGLRPTITINK